MPLPCDYSIYADHDLIVVRYFGRLTTRDILHVMDRILDDDRLGEGMDELDDFRGVTELDVSYDDIIKLADIIKGFNIRMLPPGRKAMVCSRADVAMSARFFATQFRQIPQLDIGIFVDIHKALRHLHLLQVPLGQQLLKEAAIA